jgi:glycosyltransferase involved in cell wall biosynthesis
MGRNAAGQSFLRGYFNYSNAEEFWVKVEHEKHTELFQTQAKHWGRSEPVKQVDKSNLESLRNPGVLYYPGPNIGEQAFHRAAFGHGAWSLCGITHTTSSAISMDAITGLLMDPVQPWDAVICTSTAVKDNVNRLLQAQADYLKHRLGISKIVLPQLPVIPLGIHTEDFTFTNAQKSQARAALGVEKDTLVVTYMGRLSFHAKAHPLAMYQALEKAAQTTGKSVLLIECGWHSNDYIEKAFQDAAQLGCPSVKVITLDGRLAESRQQAWAGADVFCSLVDNIQETFGIVPIEAMAAGLPVVVSDWDGYKDTVRHEIDGFRIPTLMPPNSYGGGLALRHALGIDTYDMYCGHACSVISVDVEAAAAAFTKLFSSSELRAKMGKAGLRRAQEIYDWKHIIPQYEDLWAELAKIRALEAVNLGSLAHPWPARLDPFHAFESYPTRTLAPESRLELVDPDIGKSIEKVIAYRKLAMVDFAKFVLPTDKEVRSLVEFAAEGANSAKAFAFTQPQERQAFMFRSLVWLVKLGVFRILP